MLMLTHVPSGLLLVHFVWSLSLKGRKVVSSGSITHISSPFSTSANEHPTVSGGWWAGLQLPAVRERSRQHHHRRMRGRVGAAHTPAIERAGGMVGCSTSS